MTALPEGLDVVTPNGDDVDAPDARRTRVAEVIRSGTDPDEALEYFRRLGDGRDMSFGPDTRDFGFRFRSTGDARVSLRTASVTASFSGVLRPERQYLLAWSVEGGLVLDGDRDDAVTLRAGVPVMFPSCRPFHVQSPPATLHMVHFDADFLEAVAVVGTDAAPVPLVFPVTVAPERLAPLQQVLREIAPSMLDVTVVDGDRAALDLRLATAALEAFRPVPDEAFRPAHDETAIRPPADTLGRAKAFMYTNFDRALSATEIAAAAECSVRTLQETFQRHEETSPMSFLRDLRLEKARLGLQLADPRETSVGAVAQSCGFRHMGRFSGAYLAAFGEYPGDTLRGRRRFTVVTGGRGDGSADSEPVREATVLS